MLFFDGQETKMKVRNVFGNGESLNVKGYVLSQHLALSTDLRCTVAAMSLLSSANGALGKPATYQSAS